MPLQIRGLCEGFEKCWDKRRMIMEFEKKKLNIKVGLYVCPHSSCALQFLSPLILPPRN